jgi:pimeloyl-ACP methyl ester carboxylesterase
MAQAKQIDPLVSKRTIEVDGVGLEVREAGKGRPLVVISAGEQARLDPFVNGLGARNRLFMIDVAGAGATAERDLARCVSQGLARLGLDRFSVIGMSRGAPIALALAIAAPQQVDKLILLALPPWSGRDEDLRAGLPRIEAPTLVLVGTRDRSGAAETARMLKEKISACQLLLIYDASETIAVDRPDACLSPIDEFLDRGVEFVVCHESQIIQH